MGVLDEEITGSPRCGLRRCGGRLRRAGRLRRQWHRRVLQRRHSGAINASTGSSRLNINPSDGVSTSPTCCPASTRPDRSTTRPPAPAPRTSGSSSRPRHGHQPVRGLHRLPERRPRRRTRALRAPGRFLAGRYFTSYNLSNPSTDPGDPGPSCGIDANGHGGSGQQAADKPDYSVPWCAPKNAILLDSNLTYGQSGSATITFGFTPLLTGPRTRRTRCSPSTRSSRPSTAFVRTTRTTPFPDHAFGGGQLGGLPATDGVPKDLLGRATRADSASDSLATIIAVWPIGATGAWLWHSGYRAYVVHTGSMSPTYKPGSLVIDKPAKGGYRPGRSSRSATRHRPPTWSPTGSPTSRAKASSTPRATRTLRRRLGHPS